MAICLDSFMLTMLVPILKSNTGDITSTGNYRPKALAYLASLAQSGGALA